MTNGQYAVASKILHAMESQDFADFYGTESEDGELSPFSSYVMGMPDAPSRDEILQEIVRIFHIPETGDFR